MNLNIGLLGFLTFAAYAIIFGFISRLISSRYPDSNISKAFAFIN